MSETQSTERHRVALSSRLTLVLLTLMTLDLSWRSWSRWSLVHNETFDLAFYMRIAWGFTEGDLWNPLVGASIWGLRISPILYPLGWLGELSPLAPTLLISQVIAVIGAGWVMSRIAARRLGERLAWVGALCWSLYPHLGHVVTYEFHPGTLALLPLALMIDAYDRGAPRGLILSALGVLACREDFAVILIAFGVMALVRREKLRRAALWVIGSSMLWLGAFTFILHPRFAPPNGSMSLHFGHWGETTSEALTFIITHPLALIEHLATPQRLGYLFKLCAPLAFLPLLGWRWLIPILPIVAMNLLSRFPSVTGLDSHYLTPALPFLVVAALEGLKRYSQAPQRLSVARSYVLMGVICVAHLIAGGTRLSLDYPSWAFRADAHTDAAKRILALIPPHSSIQAPDRLTPHLAERSIIYRAKSAPHPVDLIIIDTQEPQHQALHAYAQASYHRLAAFGTLELWSKVHSEVEGR